MITASRYHDISCGHRVCGHENKCSHLHGHNYRITFECAADSGELDRLGRVVDFSVIKTTLCAWLEDHWDHRFLVWKEDPLAEALKAIDPTVVEVGFNPTAENMASYLAEALGPELLGPLGIRIVSVKVEETRKCAATWRLLPDAAFHQ